MPAAIRFLVISLPRAHSPLALWETAAQKLPAGHTRPKSHLRFSNLNCLPVFDQLNITSQKLKVFLREKGVDGDYALGPYRPGNLSAGKLGKLFVRLKLGLIGFVFDNVR
jgi:hypothetical protein